jgi:lysozyme
MKVAKKHVAIAASAAVMASAAAFVAPWEGLFTHPYRDIVGVVTWCYGETEGRPKASYTPQECDGLLAAKLPRYYSEIAACWGPAIDAKLTDKQKIAFTSAAYNFGSAAFCRSSMLSRLRAGDMRGACDALMLYVRAGGRVVQGLVNRRRAERKLCLEGL